MNKLRPILTAIAVLVFFANKTSAQVTSYHDTIMCPAHAQFFTTLGNAVNYTGGTMEINFGDGTINTATLTPYANGYAAQASHNYLVFASYTIKRVFINASNQRLDSMTTFIPYHSCKYIPIQHYLDYNNNCTQDANEILPSYFMGNFSIQVDSNGYHIATLPGGSSYYELRGAGAGVYSFTLTGVSGYNVTCPSSGTVTFTIPPAPLPLPICAFGLNCQSSTYDMGVTAHNYYFATNTASGHPYSSILASNFACTPGNAQVILHLSPKYIYANAYPAPTNMIGNDIIWDLTAINNAYNTFQSICVLYNPVPGLVVGDTVHTNITITPVAGDANPLNNIYSSVDTVMAGWDPNDIKVTPGGYISAGDELTYTINFENTGNAATQNVRVDDILTEGMLANTLKVLTSSHAMTYNVVPVPGFKSLVQFQFNNINLPDASHPNQNKGFITYTVKTHPALAPGYEVTNSADIYFDYNAAVTTNTAVSVIGSPLSVQQTSTRTTATVYPNPVTGSLNIINNGHAFELVQILSATGQTIYRNEIVEGVNTIDVSKLMPGLYFVVLNGKAGTKTEKIQKL